MKMSYYTSSRRRAPAELAPTTRNTTTTTTTAATPDQTGVSSLPPRRDGGRSSNCGRGRRSGGSTKDLLDSFEDAWRSLTQYSSTVPEESSTPGFPDQYHHQHLPPALPQRHRPELRKIITTGLGRSRSLVAENQGTPYSASTATTTLGTAPGESTPPLATSVFSEEVPILYTGANSSDSTFSQGRGSDGIGVQTSGVSTSRFPSSALPTAGPLTALFSYSTSARPSPRIGSSTFEASETRRLDRKGDRDSISLYTDRPKIGLSNVLSKANKEHEFFSTSHNHTHNHQNRVPHLSIDMDGLAGLGIHANGNGAFPNDEHIISPIHDFDAPYSQHSHRPSTSPNTSSRRTLPKLMTTSPPDRFRTTVTATTSGAGGSIQPPSASTSASPSLGLFSFSKAKVRRPSVSSLGFSDRKGSKGGSPRSPSGNNGNSNNPMSGRRFAILSSRSSDGWLSNRYVKLPFSRHPFRLTRVVFFMVVGGWLVWMAVRRNQGRMGKYGGRKTLVNKRLTTKWWESNRTDEVDRLLKRPPMIPKPARPKAMPPQSHSLTQLNRLRSSFNPNANEFEWTAVIHLSSQSEVPLLKTLIPSLAKQKPTSPSRILVMAPLGLTPDLKKFGPSISLVSYSTTPLRSTSSHRSKSTLPSSAIATLIHDEMTKTLTTDWLLIVEGGSGIDNLRKDYVQVLLRASGTKEYDDAVLTGAGIVFPRSISSSFSLSNGNENDPYDNDDRKNKKEEVLCVGYNAYHQEMTQTTPVHAPSMPFIVRSSWLQAIQNGLRIDLPIETGLALSLWSKLGIPTFAIPFHPDSGSYHGGREGGGGDNSENNRARLDGEDRMNGGYGCKRLKQNLKGFENTIGPMFKREPRASQIYTIDKRRRALLNTVNAKRKKAGKVDKKLDENDQNGKAIQQLLDLNANEGVLIMLLSGEDELALVHSLACDFAQDKDLRIFLATGSTRLGNGPQVYFNDQSSLPNGENNKSPGFENGGGSARTITRCHLDVHRLGVDLTLNGGDSRSDVQEDEDLSSFGESVSAQLVDELERIHEKVEAVIYFSDGDRSREFDEVMKWTGGVFAPGKKGGERRSQKKVENNSGPVVITFNLAEIGFAGWLSALPITSLRHWHTPRIDLSIVTNNRPASLSRLLDSVQRSHYFGDDVSLSLNLEQTADVATHDLVDDYSWPHGTLTLRHRVILGGLIPAIVESWYPTSNDSYGVFLEDDVEVSPYFYGWIKFTILQYRYSSQVTRDQSSRLFGISLYQQKAIELRMEGRRPFDAHEVLSKELGLPSTMPYLSQIPCSWGAVYFPEIWREFHTYLALRFSEIALPISDKIVPEIKSNKWPRSWKKYFIELVYLRGYVMLYPNFRDFISLSTNHLEKGDHAAATDDARKRQFSVPLMLEDHPGGLLDLPEGQLPLWETLPVLDLWGSIAVDEDLIDRGWQTISQLDTCPSLPRVDIVPTFNARELLCPKSYSMESGVLVDAQPLAPVVDKLVQGAAEIGVLPPDEERASVSEPEEDAILGRGVFEEVMGARKGGEGLPLNERREIENFENEDEGLLSAEHDDVAAEFESSLDNNERKGHTGAEFEERLQERLDRLGRGSERRAEILFNVPKDSLEEIDGTEEDEE